LDWGHTRSYSNRVTEPGTGRNGNSWFVKEWPALVPSNINPSNPNTPGTICLVWVIQDALWFDYNSTTGKYVARFYVRPKLEHDAANKQFVLFDSEGRVTKFFDFDPSHPAIKRGQFKSFTDAAGRETGATYNSDNLIESFVQVDDDESNGYYYTYLEEGANEGRLEEVLYKVNGEPVRLVTYTYYGESDDHGSLGDLQLAVVSKYDGTAWEDVFSTYYRYYKTDAGNGVVHGLRFVLSPLGYQQMIDQGITPETATNEQLASFAKHEFKYNSDRSVQDETVNSGTATYAFDRTPSSFSNGFNNWKYKTQEDLPDGNRHIVYTNFAGQMILKVFIRMNGQTPTNQRWYMYRTYDSGGRTLLEASSSAVQGYDEADPELVTLRANQGLIRVFEYYPASPGTGGAPNRIRYESLKKGENGTPVKLKEWQYEARTVGTHTIYVESKEIVYQSAADGGSSPATTEYSYTWSNLQVVQKTITLPAVPNSQNGSGTSNQVLEMYDDFGRLLWRRNERGYITKLTYDPVVDAVVQRIEDVAGGAPWTVLPGTHLNLVTDYTVDSQGRVTQELGPAHQIDLNGTTTMIRRASWTLYLDATYQLWEGQGYQTMSNNSFTLINPVQIQRFDAVRRLIDQIEAVRESTSGPLTEADEFPQTCWTRWSRNDYGAYASVANRRVYFEIPEEGFGEIDVNYNQTEFAYDVMQRLVRACSPGGTITRYVYHPKDWVLSRWIGTNDTGANLSNPAGWGSPLNNMVMVEEFEYDGGKSGRDGNLTRATQYADEADSRVTDNAYDWRNRRTSTQGEINLYESYSYDNLDRITRTDRRNTNSSGVLIGRTETKYDTLGRNYRTLRYAVDTQSGGVGNALKENLWYDGVGNVIKRQDMGNRSFTKIDYDGINRPRVNYLALDPNESGYAAASSVTNDTVIEQVEITYDAASNEIFTTYRERFHNATGAGPLKEPTGAQPKARVTYSAVWPDPLGRIRTDADYGTNGGVALTRPAVAPPPSDNILVTVSDYNDRGEAWQETDPAGKVRQTTFDDAGRKIEEKLNVVTSGSGPDENKTTLFNYNPDGALNTMTVKNSVTGDQVTTWNYGTTLQNSGVASSLLLRSKIYADASTDKIEYKYNRLSQKTEVLDQRGTVHVYDYDKLGRIVHDRITVPGANVDFAVRRISYAYDVRGLNSSITSADSQTPGSGGIVNQVSNVFNDFEQLAQQQQSHDDAAGPTTPKVTYTYSNGSANTIRLEKITYPDGRKLHYFYGDPNSIDDQLSRVAALVDDNETSHLVDYKYVGANEFAIVSYPQPVLKLTYANDAEDAYTGWDRFGRIVDQRWLKSATAVERLQYGYDRANNRLYRKNVVASTGHDELYAYDGLNQIIKLQRGTLNGNNNGLTGTPVWEEDFALDQTGNWGNYLTKTNGSPTLDQDRTHNKVNAATALDNSSALLGYDGAGNMAKTPKPGSWSNAYDLTWDAWNRLIKVMDGSTRVALYTYDGLARRATNTDSSDNVLHYYYSQEWQILEERTGSSTTAERQLIWGSQRADDLILRDHAASPSPERIYSLSDPLNVTALANLAGVIQERYEYSAFGVSSVLDASFAPRTTSSCAWEARFGAYRYDAATALYQVRHRFLHQSLGRWLSRDPIGEEGGINLYAYAGNAPVGSIDPFGLVAQWSGKVLGATWKFVPKKIPPQKGVPKKEIGRTLYHAYAAPLSVTEKGCPKGKAQVVSSENTYEIKYWFRNKEGKAWEEENVSITRQHFIALAADINALGGCTCPKCAACRARLGDIYRLIVTCSAGAILSGRDCRTYGILEACLNEQTYLQCRNTALQMRQVVTAQCAQIEAGQ
jgi:RHS repeat-associated protein